MSYHTPSREMIECMNDCAECSALCEQTAQHCLGLGGEHASRDHQGLMRDCAAICGLAVGFMARDSRFAADLCRKCSEVCSRCAEDCERIASGDEMMARCAEVCRKCAETCESMAGAGLTH